MRTATTVFLATMIVGSLAGSAAAHRHTHSCGNSGWHIGGDKSSCCLDGISVDIDDGTVCLRQDGGRGKVEITEDQQLYVNGQLVSTSSAQQALLKDYYDNVMLLLENAELIGHEGAKVGVDGARLGLDAVTGLVKVLLTSYETEDYEADMERQARKLEVRAEKLENLASELEDLNDGLDRTRRRLRREIPELRKLSWF